MLSPKEQYALRQAVDGATGANLLARPEWRQRDMRAVSPDVRRRYKKAKRMTESRLGWVSFDSEGVYEFVVESTLAYSKRDKAGHGNFVGGWRGRITMDGNKLTGGRCNCPDDGADFRGFRVCKHMMWAALKVQANDVMYTMPARSDRAAEEEQAWMMCG